MTRLLPLVAALLVQPLFAQTAKKAEPESPKKKRGFWGKVFGRRD